MFRHDPPQRVQMRHHRSYLIALTIVLALTWFQPAAQSNPAPVGSPGTSLLPMSLKRVPAVTIADESLTIRDGAKTLLPPMAPNGPPLEVPAVEYRATYRFQNATRTTKTIDVGFPVVAYGHKAGDSIGGLSSFKVTFAGKDIPSKELSRSTPTLYPTADLKGLTGVLITGEFAREVPEAPDFVDLKGLTGDRAAAVRRLQSSKRLTSEQVNRVLKVLDETVFGNGDWAVQQQTLIWYAFKLQLPPGLSAPLQVSYISISPAGEDQAITYLLRTARYWGGSIGRLEVNFEPDMAFLKSGGKYAIKPDGHFKRVGDRFTYNALNAVPKFDIRISRVPKQ